MLEKDHVPYREEQVASMVIKAGNRAVYYASSRTLGIVYFVTKVTFAASLVCVYILLSAQWLVIEGYVALKLVCLSSEPGAEVNWYKGTIL